MMLKVVIAGGYFKRSKICTSSDHCYYISRSVASCDQLFLSFLVSSYGVLPTKTFKMYAEPEER